MKSNKKLAKLLAGLLNNTQISDSIVIVAVFELINNCELTLIEDSHDAYIIYLGGYYVRLEVDSTAEIYRGEPEDFFDLIPTANSSESEFFLYLTKFRDKLR
jgi:hypothetical protein